MHVAPVTTGAMTLPAESPEDKFREYTYPGDVCRENLTFYVKDDEENDKYVETSAPTEYRQYWIEQKPAGAPVELLADAVAVPTAARVVTTINTVSSVAPATETTIPEPVWDSLLSLGDC